MSKMYRIEIVGTIRKRLREPRKRIQVIAGPRQVGKTTAVEQALSEYRGRYDYCLAEGLGMAPLDWLEGRWNAARVMAKGKNGFLLVIDEIQKVPGWSELVKRLWDEDTFRHLPLKVVLLGSSRLLLQRGLDESLAGRFELIDAWHWSFADMRKAFGFTLEDYILFGGYPGAADLRDDERRWRAYVRDTIVDPSISRDILQLENIAKPALLRQTFDLGVAYSAHILSFQKMVGQLQDAGNTTTLAHYLRLLGEAGLVVGLGKHYEEVVREKTSSPKLQVCNNALLTAALDRSFADLRADHAQWGHLVESAVGVHLLESVRGTGIKVEYWNAGSKEVDYVLRKDDQLVAIEVKSEQATSVSGMREFRMKYPQTKPILVGGQGMGLETFFSIGAEDLFGV